MLGVSTRHGPINESAYNLRSTRVRVGAGAGSGQGTKNQKFRARDESEILVPEASLTEAIAQSGYAHGRLCASNWRRF